MSTLKNEIYVCNYSHDRPVSMSTAIISTPAYKLLTCIQTSTYTRRYSLQTNLESFTCKFSQETTDIYNISSNTLKRDTT